MRPFSFKKRSCTFLLLFYLFRVNTVSAQTNLLVNDGFEDINTCTEYNAECGVEGWFYLRDIKAQMLSDYDSDLPVGKNSFGLFYAWNGYKGFLPIIGTLLPCRLQKDKRYVFTGILSAKLDGRLSFRAGVAIGEWFYVPKRPFSSTMRPDSILTMKALPGNNHFYSFEYAFVANGTEKYLTFGSFIEQDTTSRKRALIGAQSISLVVDNFQLLPEDANEKACADFMSNKEKIYNYNYRHREMDYSLYGRGELNIPLGTEDSNFVTRVKIPVSMENTTTPSDTLRLGDVFFDFSKANLKATALSMLRDYFGPGKKAPIDSIYIEGHTDSVGSDERNMQLSLRRCEAVQSWLTQNDIASRQNIQIRPFGESRPVASNSSAQGRAMNRRVELIIFQRQKK